MGAVLDQRRMETDRRFSELKAHLGYAATLCQGKACVYATGSFARGEAHGTSDLDLFIVGQGSKAKRDLGRLDEICIKADLIEATKKVGIPAFDGDGKYLEHYLADELRTSLGKPEDDSSNTFTARLLLLLESRPLLEDAVYGKITNDVIAAYWQDYPKHKDEFIPAFLANDILRLWRTFCVNYEARTRRVPDEERAKRKLKNYKLKFSRLLTCYSAILHLLGTFVQNGTVAPEDAALMLQLSPTRRLEWILTQERLQAAHAGVSNLIKRYEDFLENTAVEEKKLATNFLDPAFSKDYFNNALAFGNEMASVLEAIGHESPFYRLLLV